MSSCFAISQEMVGRANDCSDGLIYISMMAEFTFPIQALFVLEAVKVRLFLIALSLLYVIGVSLARTVDFGPSHVLADCEPTKSITFQPVADMVAVKIDGDKRSGNEILPSPEQSQFGLLLLSDLGLDEASTSQFSGC